MTPKPRRRRVLRWCLRSAVGSLAAVSLYFGGGWILGRIPVNTGFRPAAAGVELFIRSNGVHTDFVMPVRHPLADWTEEFPLADFPAAGGWASHVAVGWGDRGFYLEARTFADVRLGTALTALGYLGRSAVHVEYMLPPVPGDACRELRVTEAAYRVLIEHVRAALARDAEGRPRLIPDCSYWGSDAFYEGRGRYGLFYTCNTWTNEGLRAMGVATGLWSLFPGGILDHLPR